MLFQDSGSNLHLNLTLLGAAGTITGQVGEQAVLVRLPPHRPANSSHTLRLGARSPCAGGEVRVSLRPLSSLSEAGTITKTLPCVTMNMRYTPSYLVDQKIRCYMKTQLFRTFRSADIRHDTAASDLASRDCGLACSASWLYWLDPGHWLDSVWPQTRVLILATLIISAVILLSIIIRTCCCVAKLCSKKKKLDKSTLKILLENS